MSIIDDIVDRTKDEVKRRRKDVPEKELRKRLKDRWEVSERKQVGDAEAVVNAIRGPSWARDEPEV